MNVKITQRKIIVSSAVWWGVFVVLSLFSFNPFNILNVIGFGALVFLPGALTLVALRLRGIESWGELVLSIAISIFELIIVGLISNALLPYLGIMRPLDALPMIAVLSYGMLILLAIVYSRTEGLEFSFEKYLLSSRKDYIIAFAPLLFVILSVFGAISINNVGSNLWTIAMLIGVSSYAFFIIRKSATLDSRVIAIALFFLSLSLLLMTSLRGWYITGHDIQREFRVFELSKDAGFWTIASYKDAYNACMSITILPTILSNLLRVSDPYIYKILFQIMFATVPSMVFLIARKYVTTTVAFISAIYFIAFPTFFTDMAFLNRQEIAFIFLVSMIYLVWTETISLRMRQVLFSFLGIGMVLSHYSTTYIVILLLGFLIVARHPYIWITRKLQKIRYFKHSGIAALEEGHKTEKSITAFMVAILVAGSFIWSSVLTDTSSNSVYRVIIETISVIQNNAKEDARSSDVLYSLFSFRAMDPSVEFEEYKKKIVTDMRNQEPNAYYPKSTFSNDSITLAPETLLPLTPFGQFLENEGVNVPQFNFIFRQTSAKLLQIFILIGCTAVIFSRRFTTKAIPDEFILLSVGSVLLILSQVLLPVLSVEYGLLRAFQQSLIFLGIFVVIGSETLFMWSKKMTMIAGGIAVVFLLSSTGVFTETLGGYPPQLHLENSGTYYDTFYVHRSEGVGIEWLVSRTKSNDGYTLQSATQSDRYSSTKLPILKKVDILTDIYPGLVRKNAYVFLGYTNITKHEVPLSYQGDVLIYRYPLEFLDTNKDLVYANQGVKIYR